MDNQANVHIGADRPEVWVFGAIELMEPQTRASRVELEVKCGGLSSLLLLAGQPSEAVSEGIGNAEFHTSMPKKICLSLKI